MAKYEKWKRGTLVRIVWKDACALSDGWTCTEDVKTDLPTVITVGTLFKVTNDAVIIAQDYTTDMWHSVGAIPKVNIVRIEKLAS